MSLPAILVCGLVFDCVSCIRRSLQCKRRELFYASLSHSNSQEAPVQLFESIQMTMDEPSSVKQALSISMSSIFISYRRSRF
mmetsp:Transcript_10197/g.15376  ORF Transcript_10197/g.15376 Transcript_10197/m.15376 type:complete len:82 (-) Transcript_10197:18-263(-)